MADQVILFGQSIGKWEVWSAGRPLACASRYTILQDRFPQAEGPSEHQLALAAKHKEK